MRSDPKFPEEVTHRRISVEKAVVSVRDREDVMADRIGRMVNRANPSGVTIKPAGLTVDGVQHVVIVKRGVANERFFLSQSLFCEMCSEERVLAWGHFFVESGCAHSL